jgi:hypothetical protein
MNHILTPFKTGVLKSVFGTHKIDSHDDEELQYQEPYNFHCSQNSPRVIKIKADKQARKR